LINPERFFTAAHNIEINEIYLNNLNNIDMRLLRKLSQHRRDFQGEYKCEFCGNIVTDKGMSSYDDRYYMTEVIPNKICPNCKKSTNSENGEIELYQTKYPEGYQI
jgi:hypothetical protein